MVVALLSLAAPSAAAGQSDLEKARAMYNEGRFEESIAAAVIAKHKPDSVPSATLIEARARLERFRQNGDAGDLAAARKDLVSLNARVLAPQEVIEWQIGIGTALFLENQPGPAAEMFATVLPAARERLSPAELDKLVEWWASTVSRVAESQSGSARKDAVHRDVVGGAGRARAQPTVMACILLAGRRGTRLRRFRRLLECCLRRLDSRRLSTRGRARPRRPRPLRDSDTHPRAGTSAHGPTPRLEDYARPRFPRRPSSGARWSNTGGRRPKPRLPPAPTASSPATN